jgi:hypothetical protein
MAKVELEKGFSEVRLSKLSRSDTLKPIGPAESVLRAGPNAPVSHAYTDGLVFLTYTVLDEEVGEEVERIEAVPCRRCAENGRR